ncbi:MAG TPA: hypothetical protein VKY74_27720 [Chloroflexia bacterium]|nr:hypothetical protein [Chloroflexia bacterium]
MSASPPRPAGLADPAVRGQVIAGLERLVWAPQAGVGDWDRVEAIAVLGQLADPAARAALLRVLRDGARRIVPRPLGRWLRDTALDALLRAPDRGAADRALAGYYNFVARLLHGRLERHLVFDDIPLLVRSGRAGLLARAYLLPLIGLLFGGALLIDWLTAPGGLLSGRGPQDLGIWIAGPLFFIALGLGIFNLHQVGLVLLVARWGRQLPLPGVPGAGAVVLAGGLAAAAAILALGVLGSGLALASGVPISGPPPVTYWLLLLPLLVLPCYILAHDLEAGARQGLRGPAGIGAILSATALRIASGVLYIVYILVAYAVTFLAQLLAGRPGGTATVLAGLWPFLLYLALAPVLVLPVLAGLGWLQAQWAPAPGPGGVP